MNTPLEPGQPARHDADSKRFGLFVTVLVAFLGLGAFLVIGALVYEMTNPDELPPAPPKQSIPGFAPPESTP